MFLHVVKVTNVLLSVSFVRHCFI